MRNYRIILLRGLTENMKSAIIMDIQRYSIHDGPGIRTTVFFKGCHMACRWCHNPESQRREPELLFYENRCINCGECMLLCRKNAHSMESGKHRIDLSLCAGCPGREACSRICPAEAHKAVRPGNDGKGSASPGNEGQGFLWFTGRCDMFRRGAFASG